MVLEVAKECPLLQCQMFKEKWYPLYNLTANLKISHTVMKQAVTHLLISVMAVKHQMGNIFNFVKVYGFYYI